MIAWPRFVKRLRKHATLIYCEPLVIGSQSDGGEERVQISFREDSGRRLLVDMTVEEARVLARSLLTMWPDTGRGQP
jgi:hypothetical protein